MKIQTFEQFACSKLLCSRELLQWTIENLHPTDYIHLAEQYAHYVLKSKLESITDEVEKFLRNSETNYDSGFLDAIEWLKEEVLKDE